VEAAAVTAPWQAYLVAEDFRLMHLRELLESRPDWRFEAGQQTWFFGQEGAGRLALSVRDGRYLLYRADHDSDISFSIMPDLVEWFDAHESEHAGLTELQKQLMGDLLVIETEQALDPEAGNGDGS
jgi:hypothetical protein